MESVDLGSLRIFEEQSEDHLVPELDLPKLAPMRELLPLELPTLSLTNEETEEPKTPKTKDKSSFLTVNTFNGDSFKIEFPDKWSIVCKMNVSDLKKKVQEVVGIAPAKQRLCLPAGRELLVSSASLKDAGLKNKMALNLMFKMSNIGQGENPFEPNIETNVDEVELSESDEDEPALLSKLRAPDVGDPVVCRYHATMFYTAKVIINLTL